MDRELNETEKLLYGAATDMLRRTVAEDARLKAEYDPQDDWQEKLWVIRCGLPLRYPLYVGGKTALQEELPNWIAALEKELAYSKSVRDAMHEEFDLKQRIMALGVKEAEA